MILTTIDGIPLYSTMQEALAWASSRGVLGYHTHVFQGQTGYMGGSSHGSVTLIQTPVTTTRYTGSSNSSY